MKQIDKMLARVLRIRQKKRPRFHMAFVSHDEDAGKWQLRSQIMTGDEVRCFDTEHASRDEAEKAIDGMMAKYPNLDYRPLVIYDDLDQ